VHAGTPGAGEAFISAWSQVAGAARDAADTIRSTVAQLPENLDGPASTSAVTRHLLSYADGLDTYAERAQTLARQANAYADNQIQAREDIPDPQRLAAAQNRVQTLAQANAASGGKWAAQLAAAVTEKNQLDAQAVSGNSAYHVRTEAATAGEDPGTGDERASIGPAGPTTADPAAGGGSGRPDPAAGAASPQTGGEMASLLPELASGLLGSAGGLIGGALGAVIKGPEAVMQASMQAVGAATQGLSGLAHPKSDPAGRAAGGPGGPDTGDAGDPSGAGGDAPVTPAGGETPELGVSPATGASPTPAIAPVGATDEPGSVAAPAGAPGMSAMGMPMGGLAGAPGSSGGAAGKDAAARPQTIETREIPHTEDVTGRVDTNRLSAAASHRDRNAEPPGDDNPPDPPEPVVRRLVTGPPKEPS
jgi:hypothetical protein